MATCPEDSRNVNRNDVQQTEQRVGNASAVSRIEVLGKLKLSEGHYKLCLRVELVVLCVLIAVVWALLAIPIFIFYIAEVCIKFYTS